MENVDTEVASFSSYDEFKKSDKYKSIMKDLAEKDPKQLEYFHDIAVCNYWYDQHLFTLSPKSQTKFTEKLKQSQEQYEKINIKPDKFEFDVIETYSPEEHLEKFGELEVVNENNEPILKIEE